MVDLFAAYSALPVPRPAADAETFSATSVSGARHRLAKDAQGWPALLISTSSAAEHGAHIHLEHLDVRHGVRCRITDAKGNREDGFFTVIRCSNADSELASYFLRVVEPVVRELGPAPKPPAIEKAIGRLVELFRALTQPPARTVSGLWAELLLIRHAEDPTLLVDAWHVSPEDKFDFSAGAQRVEVKSSSRRDRIHHFSLEQLAPPAGCTLIVASMVVERAGAGLSLDTLISEVRNLVTSRPELQQRIDHVVATTLGNTLRPSLAERYDQEQARESLRLFDGETVPRVPEPLPRGVADVRFKADLSESKVISKQFLRKSCGIFAALVH